MIEEPRGQRDRQGVLAVVVAYNRSALLARVLDALQQQTAGPIDVLVVDNASTDATAAVAAAAGVGYFNTGANLGGAGGFAWGLELAMASGYRFAYIMDDDAIPHPDAVEVLLGSAALSPGKAFYASVPVDEAGSHEGVAGMPTPSSAFELQLARAPHGEIAVSSAAFLGILLDLEVVADEALPYPEFFIWCDDVEYTSRVARNYGAVCCPRSRITHLSASMQALGAGRSLGWKYFFQVRNQLWLARWGLAEAGRVDRTQALMTALRAIPAEFSGRRPSWSLAATTAKAVAQGVRRRPRAHQPGSLLAEHPEAQRWLQQRRSQHRSDDRQPVLAR